MALTCQRMKEGGVKTAQNPVNVVYEWSLMTKTHHFFHIIEFISCYNYFQMVIEVVDNLKWESLIIFYSQDQDIILWQNFKTRGFIQPQFIKIPEFDSEQEILKILLGVKHKRTSTKLNLILFVDQLHISETFLRGIKVLRWLEYTNIFTFIFII